MRHQIAVLSAAAVLLTSCSESITTPTSMLRATGPASSLLTAYELRELGTLGGPSGIAQGINDAGVVVGRAELADGRTHAFIFDGTMRDLDPASGYSEATAINSSGQVVGARDQRAFLWQDGQFVWVGPPQSWAFGVSDAGHVVGMMSAFSQWRPFVWRAGHLTVLPGLSGVSRATAVNSSGVVAGYSDAPTGGFRAVRWTNGAIADLGTLGGRTAIAWGINESGVIVGRSSLASGGDVAFRWTAGTLEAMSSSRSEAMAINDAGQVAGAAFLDGLNRAVVWSGSETELLSSLGSGHAVAAAINENGDVAGWSFDDQWRPRPVAWIRVTLGSTPGSITGGGGLRNADGRGIEAEFSLQARVRDETSAPDGAARLRALDGSVELRSTALQRLVIDGQTATLEGHALLNDTVAPDGEPYRFRVTVVDGSPDTFRIRVWHGQGAGVVAYEHATSRAVAGNVTLSLQ